MAAMEKFLVDPRGRAVGENATPAALGIHSPGVRMVWALPPTSSGLTRRYGTHPPSEDCLFGMNFDFVIPSDVAIVGATLDILVNEAPPVTTADWSIGPVAIEGRVVYARLSGGTDGTDYQIRWTVTDSDGNVWPRTALVLVAATS